MLGGKDISISGLSFGDVSGVVLIDNQKSEIGYWNDARIDIKYSGTVKEPHSDYKRWYTKDRTT